MLDDDRSGASARTADGAPERAMAGLRGAVTRLQRELAAYRPPLPDRSVAEDELDALARQAAPGGGTAGRPADGASGPGLDTERLRHCLLLVAAALGSVSALAAPLDALRDAVERAVETPAPHAAPPAA